MKGIISALGRLDTFIATAISLLCSDRTDKVGDHRQKLYRDMKLTESFEFSYVARRNQTQLSFLPILSTVKVTLNSQRKQKVFFSESDPCRFT